MLKLVHRRSSIEIIADILRLGEAGRTEILCTANLSYYQLREYINLMMRLGLVSEAPPSNQLVRYRVTRKGFKLLRSIDSVQEVLEGKESIDL